MLPKWDSYMCKKKIHFSHNTCVDILNVSVMINCHIHSYESFGDYYEIENVQF